MANELRPCPCDIGDKFDYGGRGQEIQVEHIKAYVSKPSTSTDKAVIVIHDIFGWELPNTRYIADMLTANGYVTTSRRFLNKFRDGDATTSPPWGAYSNLRFFPLFTVVLHKFILLIFNPRSFTVTLKMFSASVAKYGHFLCENSKMVRSLLQVTVLEQKLKQNTKVDYEVKIYPGQTHGFVHRKKENINPQDKPYIEEGRRDMINWLNKYM
uniref:Carboxymethylenebutenolidase homolog n=1 Tax=Pavo cristatus TaxID=9049 RepID=A0A8C9ENJ5_PAVCR